MKTSLICSLALAALCSPALAGPPPPSSVYRFDVTITGLDSKPATYTLMLGENQRGTVESGSNIPYATSSTTTSRESLGMKLEMSYQPQAGVLVVAGGFDLTALDASGSTANPTWRRVGAHDMIIPVTPGKPTLFTNIYDTTAHKTYEVTVTATKLL
ncbi:MAG TPA: hypothetical protein VMJ10_17520 [Kofleriaceae bacterium]|nr:hypothetical protein [Kofleriaceae bacterium]